MVDDEEQEAKEDGAEFARMVLDGCTSALRGENSPLGTTNPKAQRDAGMGGAAAVPGFGAFRMGFETPGQLRLGGCGVRDRKRWCHLTVILMPSLVPGAHPGTPGGWRRWTRQGGGGGERL